MEDRSLSIKSSVYGVRDRIFGGVFIQRSSQVMCKKRQASEGCTSSEQSMSFSPYFFRFNHLSDISSSWGRKSI